jgi:hypothetical protein
MRVVALIQRTSTAGKRFCPVVLLLTIAITGAHAQSQSVVPPKTATIKGTVIDQSGGSISEATVSLEAGDGSTLQTKVSKDGHFTLDAWQGEYLFKVSAQAFKTHSQPISLAAATSLRQDIVLAVSSDWHGCGVCVTPEPPLIETLSDPLTSTLSLNPLPPFKLRYKSRYISRNEISFPLSYFI